MDRQTYNPMQPLVDIASDPYCPWPGTVRAELMQVAIETRRLVDAVVDAFPPLRWARWLLRRLFGTGGRDDC